MLRDAVTRITRTSSFRLALQSAALSVFGAIIVFAIIYRASESTVRSALEATVTSEQADVISDARDDASILKAVQVATAESDGTFYALMDPSGKLLAGNLALSPQAAQTWNGWRTMGRDDGISLPPHITAIHGLSTKLQNGDVLYVAENASALEALNELIRNAFLAVFGTILAIGFGGGLFIARQTLTRVESMSKTSHDIMEGDLTRRIPLNGTGDEFDRLATNLNAMLDRIEVLMENLQQVSNDIAHDLRSPLARLREHLELARHHTREPATQTAFDEGIAQVDSALSIFSALLRIAEVEAGARRRDFKVVDLSTLLRDLVETFETVAESESMTLTAAIADGLSVAGDRSLLAQMLVNIIENSIRHSPAGSKIFIEAGPRYPDHVEIVISDNGPGIPPEEYTHVLQRFVRIDASRHSPGTGLGLALVAAVVELHNGKIDLRANNPGLRVSILLNDATEHRA